MLSFSLGSSTSKVLSSASAIVELLDRLTFLAGSLIFELPLDLSLELELDKDDSEIERVVGCDEGSLLAKASLLSSTLFS